jgi:tryptophan synthase alpha subunit
MPIEVWLAERTEPQRRAAEAVLAIVRRHRTMIVEAVSVGILIKRERTVVELRPKKRWLDLSFITTQALDSDRIARTLEYAGGYVYFVHLADETDVDAELRGWLTAALRGPRSASSRS